MSKRWTNKAVMLELNVSYTRGFAAGKEAGRKEALKEVSDSQERLVLQTKVEIVKGLSQALSAVAGAIDSLHGAIR